MNEISPSVLLILLLAAVLADALLMFRLRSRKKTRSGVYVLGQYSPLLTGLGRAPGIFRRLAQPRGAFTGMANRAAGLAAGAADGFRRRAAVIRPALAVLAAGCGAAGQVEIFVHHNLPGGIPWAAASGVAWLGWCLLNRRGSVDAAGPTPPAVEPSFLIRRRDFRILALLLSLQMTALAVGLYWNRPPGNSHWDIFALWAAASTGYLAAFLPAPGRPARAPAAAGAWKRLAPFLLVFLLAAGLRFYRLGELPPVMENDEGTVGMRVLEVIAGERRSMFDVYGGYGSMYFFLQSLPVRWLGRNMLALRAATALAGTLTIPLAAWTTWRLFGYRTALAAAALLAASHLHVHFSRVSPTAGSFDPLFACGVSLLVFEALTRRRPHLWAAAGVLMGLALHFYVGARALPVIVLAVLAGAWLLRRDLLKGQAGGLLAMAGGFLVAGGPILSWALRHPDGFNQRVNQVGVFQNGWLDFQMALHGQSMAEALAAQLENALLIFNYHPAGWFYQASEPVLGFAGGLLLFFGLILGLSRLRQIPFLIVSAWFWVTLFTGQVLMVDPGPNAYRTLGLLPAACMLVAAAGDAIAVMFGRLFRQWGRQAAAILLAALVVVEGGWNMHYYFSVWNGAGSYGDENTRRASLIGSFLGAQPPGTEILIAKSQQFGPERWQALDFLRDGTEYSVVEASLVESLEALSPRAGTVVVVPAAMQAELERLKTRRPHSVVTPYVFEGKLYFWSVVLNGE